jgi:hypothetical protein
MSGNGDLFKNTVLLALGIVAGGVAVGHVLSARPLNLTLADLLGSQAVIVNGVAVQDPIVTGSVGQAPPGRTIILDPCTGLSHK